MSWFRAARTHNPPTLMTELGHMGRGGGREEGGPGIAAKKAKGQKWWATKMSGLFRKGPLGGASEFRVGVGYTSHIQ